MTKKKKIERKVTSSAALIWKYMHALHSPTCAIGAHKEMSANSDKRELRQGVVLSYLLSFFVDCQ